MNEAMWIYIDSKLSIIEENLKELRKLVDENYKDRPRYYDGGRQAYYTILTPMNKNGTWTVPERIFIPKDYWGKEVTTREISFVVENYIPLEVKYPFK